jgi:RimJ/RimL family protein N-acetyltransferase
VASLPERHLHLPSKGDQPEATLVLRSCLPEDAPLFEPFWRRVSLETTHTLQTPDFPPDFSKIPEVWAATLRDPVDARIGAFVDGRRLAGLIGFHGLRAGHPWVRHIGSFGMMVLQEYWGRGVGRALLQTVEDHACSVGIRKIEAEVRVENGRGWNFYQTCGYRIEGTRTRAALIQGKFQDEYWIAKDLDR